VLQVEWKISDRPVPYDEAVVAMESRVQAIVGGQAPELVWLLEHPPLYTAGTSADPKELLDPGRLPVHRAGRGGRYTYHGPGQRIAYVMLDLKARRADIRSYVCALEDWMIWTLARFNVKGERRTGRIGIWVDRGHGREDKIGALGVRIRRSVSYHGIALNVDPDLGHFAGIVPCGVSEHGVTSLVDLGLTVTMPEVDTALRQGFEAVFGPGGLAEARFGAACEARADPHPPE
jgi:lipoyl(octanoyl) transferase